MNVRELMKEIAKEFGFSEDEIEKGYKFADSVAAPTKRDKEMLLFELPESWIESIKDYMRTSLSQGISDRKANRKTKIDEDFQKIIERN